MLCAELSPDLLAWATIAAHFFGVAWLVSNRLFITNRGHKWECDHQAEASSLDFTCFYSQSYVLFKYSIAYQAEAD